MRSYRLVFLLLAVASLTAAGVEFAFAHGGGPDSLGCHTDRAEAEKGDSLFFRDELHRMSGELPGPSKPCGAARAQPSGTGS